MQAKKAKSPRKGDDWETRQRELVEMRFRAAEKEKRMAREAARQRRKGGPLPGAVSAATVLEAVSTAPQGDVSRAQHQHADGDFDWGMDVKDEASTDFHAADLPVGLDMATVMDLGSRLQVRTLACVSCRNMSRSLC